ncbi:MAG: hypothetical protein AAGG01_08345, partial [Planctomycetota bacterium]
MLQSLIALVPLSTLTAGAPAVPEPLPLPGTLPRSAPNALDATTDAIRAAGDDVEALAKLAAEWTDKGDEAAAVRAWERVLHVDPDHEAA